MYLSEDEWSAPEGSDPPPCFRQGDLVLIDWIRWEYAEAKASANGMKLSLELRRSEVVALVSTCCDLVLHKPPKRKGFLVSPVKPIPKHIAKSQLSLEALRAPMHGEGAAGAAFPNLVYYAKYVAKSGREISEGVIYLEALTMIDEVTLDGAVKLSELTPDARADFKERLKWHFSRGTAT